MQHDPNEARTPPRRGKVAIPRQDRGAAPSTKTRNTNREERVLRACKTCRKRKVRCSGDVPTCKNCETTHSLCVYEHTRRDRLNEASNLNHTLAALLRDLQTRVDDDDKQRISAALDDVEDDIITPTTTPSVRSLTERAAQKPNDDYTEPPTSYGEAHVTASVGSNEDLDYLDEDLLRNRQSRETGYIGQNSEVQWLRSVQRQTEHTGAEPHTQTFGPPGSGQNAVSARAAAMRERKETSREDARQGSMKHITDSSFYLDSSSIDVDIMVDPYEFPDPDIAEKLFQCYIDTVHSAIPLVSHTFEDQFRRYLASVRYNGPFLVPDKWRAQLNLIFAIGAKYSHLINAEWAGDERDHLIYMTRALQLLGLNNTIMIISAPDLELVQATAALAFYFLVIGHVSRAWIMIGVSIRLALSLGLHLRNVDPGSEESRKATLEQAWWSLHSVECLVNSMTGRPPAMSFEDCTVPLPYSARGEERGRRGSSSASAMRGTRSRRTSDRSSTSQTHGNKTELHGYRIGHITNTLILQKVLLNLYSPRTASKSWEFVQGKIKQLLRDLEDWANTTYIRDQKKGHFKDSDHFDREQYLLKIDYWSLKVLITRPCLCRLDGRIRNESQASHSFNAKVSRACVEAAVELANLFSDEPDLGFIYRNGPWWALMHVIMQAMAVLLLEVAYKCEDMKDEDQPLIEHIKRLIRWLRALQVNDPMAANAHKIVRKILKVCAPSLQRQAHMLLAEDLTSYPQPSASNRASDHNHAKNHSQAGLGLNQMYGTTHNSTIDPNFLQYSPQQTVESWTGYPTVDADATWSQNSASFPLFGNPFYTNFDQGPPLGDLNNVWKRQDLPNTFPAMNAPPQDNSLGEYPSEMDFSSTYQDTQDLSGLQDPVARSPFGGLQ